MAGENADCKPIRDSKDCQDQCENCIRLGEELAVLEKRLESLSGSDKSSSPSEGVNTNLAAKYRAYFEGQGSASANLAKVLESHPEKAREIVRFIFQNAFEMGQIEVRFCLYQELQKLFQPNSTSLTNEAADDLVHGYGRLLYASGLRDDHCQEAEELRKKILEKVSETCEMKYGHGQNKVYTQEKCKVDKCLDEAVMIAWHLVTVNPPMIVSQPEHFAEGVTEKIADQWSDDSASASELQYFQPALFRSCMGEVEQQAKVGNKAEEHK